jgi:hypothetical protein
MAKRLNLDFVEHAFDDDLTVRFRRLGFTELLDVLQNAGMGHLIGAAASGQTEARVNEADLIKMMIDFADGAIVDWTIESEDGTPTEPSRANIDKMMVACPGFAAWLFEAIFVPAMDAATEEEAEKNVSAPLPNGSSAGAPDTAADATESAPAAPAA